MVLTLILLIQNKKFGNQGGLMSPLLGMQMIKRTFINGVMQPDVQPDGIPEGETSPAVEGIHKQL